MKNLEKTIIVDFDGTICEDLPVMSLTKIGPPQPQVKEALKRLKDLGYFIRIHSCRTATYWKERSREKQIQLIRKFLGKHEIPYDDIIIDIHMDKPLAKYYIDNKGIQYNNNWMEIVKQIENLEKKK